MEYFTSEGHWWLPGTDESKAVHGPLIFDEHGLRLEAEIPLREPVGSESVKALEATYPVVLGCLRDNREVTLFGTRGMRDFGISMPVRYRVPVVMFGGHVMESRFEAVRAQFDYLSAWLRPSDITQYSTGEERITVDLTRGDLIKAQGSGYTLRFITGVQGQHDERSVNLEQWCAAHVELAEPGAWDELLEDHVVPVRELLTLALGCAIRITSLHLAPVGGDGTLYETVMPLIQPQHAEEVTVGSFASRELLTGARVGDLAELYPRWRELWSEHRYPFALLHASHRAPFMYSDQRFAATFQCAEALSRSFFKGGERPKEEHTTRVRAVIAAAREAGVSEADLRWAQNVLQSRNDKTLRVMMNELLCATGVVGQQVVETAPDFVQHITSFRGRNAHGASAQDEDHIARYWHEQILRYVVRTFILLKLGISDAAEFAVGRHSFREALEQLRPNDVVL